MNGASASLHGVEVWARRLSAELCAVLLPKDCAATIFDACSEALSGIARQTQASRIAIALTITPREVTLLVRDSGQGGGEAVAAAVRVSLPIRRS